MGQPGHNFFAIREQQLGLQEEKEGYLILGGKGDYQQPLLHPVTEDLCAKPRVLIGKPQAT